MKKINAPCLRCLQPGNITRPDENKDPILPVITSAPTVTTRNYSLFAASSHSIVSLHTVFILPPQNNLNIQDRQFLCVCLCMELKIRKVKKTMSGSNRVRIPYPFPRQRYVTRMKTPLSHNMCSCKAIQD